MVMSNTKRAKVGTTKITQIGKGTGQKAMFGFEWGLYFWRLPDGHLFKDDEGRMLNVPSIKGDISQMSKIRQAAAHYGQPDGEPWFYAGVNRATDDEYEEQLDRLKDGLIPSMNDLGAVDAAQRSNQLYGDAE
jgi:hypothetical protein